MNSQRSNCLLKALLFFNVWLLTLATDNFQLEASFDGNLETYFGTASALSLLNSEVDVPTTSLHYSPENDPSLFKTQLANENLGVFHQLGINIDDFAHSLLHGNLGHGIFKSDSQTPPGQALESELCSIVPVLGLICSEVIKPPASSECRPPGSSESRPPGSSESRPPMSSECRPPGSSESRPPPSSPGLSPGRYAYLTNNPALIGTVSLKHRSLILPSKVESSIVKTTFL